MKDPKLLQMDDTTAAVLALMEQHKDTWKGAKDHWWWYCLWEEICELELALDGDGDDPPEWELMQIASICLNWLRNKKEMQR